MSSTRILPGAFDLTGRVALVTGAGSPDGIGMATARLLGDLGAAVAVTATTDRVHERAAELTQAGVTALGLVADLTDEDLVRAAVADVTRTLGPPTVLVNNAGMTSVATPALDAASSGGAEFGTVTGMTYGQWRTAVARNLDTAFLTTRAVLPGMQSAGWGRVVMVSSVTGPVMSMRGEAAYAAAKAGMLGLTRSLAVDYASDGVTANIVTPRVMPGSVRKCSRASATRRRAPSASAPPRSR